MSRFRLSFAAAAVKKNLQVSSNCKKFFHYQYFLIKKKIRFGCFFQAKKKGKNFSRKIPLQKKNPKQFCFQTPRLHNNNWKESEEILWKFFVGQTDSVPFIIHTHSGHYHQYQFWNWKFLFWLIAIAKTEQNRIGV